MESSAGYSLPTYHNVAESLQEDPEDNSRKTPLPLKEKAFLGFQSSLLYPKRTGHLGFLRLHDTTWRAAAGREQNGLFEARRLESEEGGFPNCLHVTFRQR